MPSIYKPQQEGFTLIELIVTIAVFAIIAAGMLGCFGALTKSIKIAREKDTIASLETNYLEAVRNMPYSQVGTLQGNPHGTLPDQPNALTQIIAPNTYNIYYTVNYIHDPADTTTGTPDYKQVKMSILNKTTNQLTDFVTTVVPQGIITNPNTGAVQVFVINSQGQPLVGANVNITYPTSTPYLYNLPDITDNTGQVTEIGLPAAVHSYRIVATQPGYSTDSTTPITAQNPNPVHPDPTVATGTVTQLTLSIDQLANLNIKTLNSVCQPLSGVNVNVEGSKLIGTSPSVYKFNNNFSSSNGLIALNNIEWDTYTPTLLTGQSWVIGGTSPIQAINVLPGATATFSMILDPVQTPNSLLVIVKDASTGAALEGATVQLQNGAQNYYGTTGGSVWTQSNWSGGPGSTSWNSTSSPTQYFLDNGNVDVATLPTGVRIKKVGGNYLTATGTLESSTFDTGTNQTNYTILSWAPVSQSASTTVEFQIAANNDNATWNYVGPDGTSGTYFTTSGTDMGSLLDNNEFFRYKVFLKTADTTKTPVLTSVNANFVTGCYTPGQSFFNGLAAGSNYSLIVSAPGYTTQNINPINISGNSSLPVMMSP